MRVASSQKLLHLFVLTLLMTTLFWVYSRQSENDMQDVEHRSSVLAPRSPSFLILEQTQNVMYSASLWTTEPNKEWTVCSVPSALAPLTAALCSQPLNAFLQDALKRWNCSQAFPCTVLKPIGEDFPVSYRSCAARYPCAFSNCSFGSSLMRLLEATHRPVSVLFSGLLSFSEELLTALQQYRSEKSLWVFQFGGESITYYEHAANESLLSRMNLTIGYDRSLYDIPSLPFIEHYYDDLASPKPLPYWKYSRTDSTTSDSSPVLASVIVSNCWAPSPRNVLIKDLMRYVRMDSYGLCSHNKDVTDEMREMYINSTHPFAEKMFLLGQYKFNIAIENSINEDYVTEKIWQPLVVGTVPVYLGAPNIHDYLPCEHCIIDMRDFLSMKHLADYLLSLNEDEAAYMAYHEWRKKPRMGRLKRMRQTAEKFPDLAQVICSMAGGAVTREELRTALECVRQI